MIAEFKPETESAIRARAHQIWEEEGRPNGRHDIHWQSALERVQITPLAKELIAQKAPRAKVDQAKAAKKK